MTEVVYNKVSYKKKKLIRNFVEKVSFRSLQLFMEFLEVIVNWIALLCCLLVAFECEVRKYLIRCAFGRVVWRVRNKTVKYIFIKTFFIKQI